MSDKMTDNENPEEPTKTAQMLFGWTATKSGQRWFFIAIAVISIVLLLVDFFIEKHAYKPVKFSEMPTFYGLYGFLAFAFVVICGWPLGKILRKDENYYGDVQDDETHEDGEGK